jgi:DNA-binding MarR family transcriptional regulator
MEILRIWYVQALLISAGAALFLNGAPFLPKLRDIRPRRIQARLVGYVGLGTAYLLWCVLNPQQPAWPNAMGACAVIVAGTLAVNVLIHWYREDNPRDGERTFRIGVTEKGQALLEEMLRREAPEKYGWDGLFRREQRRETAEERWENVMFPVMALPGLIDEIMACIIKAMREENSTWLLPALANAQEVRQGVCKVRWNSLLWYNLFWPKHAR